MTTQMPTTETQHDEASGPIVCGVDNSPSAREAAGIAARLAHLLGLDLVLSYVADPRIGAVRPQDAPIPSIEEHPWLASAAKDAGRRLLDSVARDEQLAPARTYVEFGDTAAGLLDVASNEGASLIAIGSTGQGLRGSPGLGSVAGRLPAAARCPVLFPRQPSGCSDLTWAPAGRLAIVCGLDGSSGSFRAALLAADLCARSDGHLVLVHSCGRSCRVEGAAAHGPDGGLQLLHAVADLVRDRVDVSIKLTTGDPVEQLLACAVDRRANMIVAGATASPRRRPRASVPARLASARVAPVMLLPSQAEIAPRSGYYQLEAVA